MSIFANCSRHFPNENLFANCTQTTAACRLIQDLNTVLQVSFVAYYLCASLFTVAALANFYCLCVTLPMFFRLREESRKRYVFLVTRCVSALLTVVTMLLVTCVFENTLAPSPSNFYLYAIVMIISETNRFGLLGSYVGLSLLLYIGVKHPMFFNAGISIRFVYGMVFLIYVAALLYAVPSGMFEAAIINPGVIKCDLKTCAPVINLISFIITSVCLVFTIAILFFVLVSLLRHNYKLHRRDTLSSSASSMGRVRRRLAWTLLAVIFIAAAEIIPFAFLIHASRELKPGCDFFYRANKLAEEAVAAFTETLVWCFVLLVDPLMNIFYDKKVSAVVHQQFRWLQDRLLSCRPPVSLLP